MRFFALRNIVILGLAIYGTLGTARAQALLSDDFDDGNPATASNGVNGGFVHADNGGGTGAVAESGGMITVSAETESNNSGIYSGTALNLSNETFFTVSFIIDGVDGFNNNGVFLGITEDNATFFRNVDNFGVVIGSSNYGDGSDDVFLVANDGSGSPAIQATLLEDIDTASLTDGFEVTFTVKDNETYSYAVSGISGTGLSIGRGELTNITYAGQFDDADHVVASIQTSGQPRNLVVDRIEVTPSTPFHHFRDDQFVDTDGDSYSDEAEQAFGTGTNNPSNFPDFTSAITKPNVVIIYADDMGFSDMSFYGRLFGTPSPASTPNMDALAAAGVTFTQGHSSNGVCTPSRYALLTGKYNWREFDGISGFYGKHPDMPHLPKASDVTIAEFLKTQGYDTAAFGKWHLGGRWYKPGTNTRILDNPSSSGGVDWTRRIEEHATDVGFDSFRGMGCVINYGPYVYMQDDRVVVWDETLDDGYDLPPTDFQNGGAAPWNGGFRPATTNDTFAWLKSEDINTTILGNRYSFRDGLGDPSFRQVDVGPIMVQDFEKYIGNRAATEDADPFFAYVALYSPHLPYATRPEFVGSCGIPGFDYGDFLVDVDDRIGRIVTAIDNAGFGPDTLVVFTSDNGTENGPMSDSLAYGRDSNGPFRGNKRDVWEGGTRVPFVVRWPGQAVPGMISNELIWQGDIFATIAAYLGADLPHATAPDGESFLNIIRGQQKPSPRRPYIVVSSKGDYRGLKTTEGWKLIDAVGGNSKGTSWDSSNEPIELVKGTNRGVPKQLFNLNADLGSDNNLIADLTNETDIRNALLALTGTDLLGEMDALRGALSTEVYSREPDNDADSMANSFENQYPGLDREDPRDGAVDFEPDGLSNLQEETFGCNPVDDDTDADGLKDGTEVLKLGTRPGNAHSDGDSLEDGDEVLCYGTDPLLADTDGDGVSDSDELDAFSNPRNSGQKPNSGVPVETAFDPSVVQVVGVAGTAGDPRAEGAWDSGADGPGAGTLYVRERKVDGNDLEWRSRLFVKFDLSGLSNNFQNARLRVHQVDRLNDRYSGNLELSRVTDAWDVGGSDYPLFENTGVADAFDFGNNEDFGTAIDASGFFSGTPGVAGTDDSGFDPAGRVSAIVGGWYNGTTTNHGLRIAFSGQSSIGAAFAALDDPATPGVNEKLQLLVATQTPGGGSFDSDGDKLADAFEMAQAGNLTTIDGALDDDGDGVVNAVEVALGSSMSDKGSRPKAYIEVSQGSSVEMGHLRAREGGAGYLVSYSTDLANWSPALESMLSVKEVVDQSNGYERVTYELLFDGHDHLFFNVTPVFP
ncbi:sulfatase-like hydrolase/transferase [Pontiella sulfatireligans]|uniref:Arylsulfatase n=1 Tax=Pontiella sulfatireligans TaxID=2750658 RepID=A0A6C2UFC3_9BACT|nr:sulfatase-like hydrolase/transferase [Pontiella sulfatireligans]SPS74255.1 sulfatase S1_15 [Kiritimatiellales bacterium]VGO18845.1 Arylsulfatase [Pontiella sulfatireligans]